MTEARAEAGFKPDQFGIKPEDPVLERFSAISATFAKLRLPITFLAPEYQRQIMPKTSELRAGDVYNPDESNLPPDFRYGIDYFFGQYKGNPSTITQNAEAAIYHGRQGVPVWSLLKSVAYTIPGTDRIIIAHVRGDRKVDTAKMARSYGVDDLPMATEEQLNSLGLERGTVNPLLPDLPNVEHVFDRDLVDGDDYPGSDMVFTSSGDHRFFVGFDIRKYLRAKSGLYARQTTREITEPEEGSKRIVARKPVFVLGGDSLDDALAYGQVIGRDITQLLIAHNQYFGDQSVTKLRVLSDPEIAGSINTELYGPALRDYIKGQTVPELTRSVTDEGRIKPLVTFGSFAMEGIAGDILEETEGIEYVGSKGVVEDILASLKTAGIEPKYSLLLGLDSAYDPETSAFSGKILDESPNINPNVRKIIQTLTQDYKTGLVEKAKSKVFQMFEATLRGTANAAGIPFESLQGQVVAGVVAVSELEGLMRQWNQLPDDDEKNRDKYNNMFAVIRSNDPAVIKAEVDRIRAEDGKKIILAFISPKQAVAETIAQKTLGLAA